VDETHGRANARGEHEHASRHLHCSPQQDVTEL